jgi:uncharacterized integral membrane protein (TIGR00697 family)
MSNGIILLISALVDMLFIFYSSRRGVEWLFGTIVLNLILVSIFGAKLMMIGGYTTNAGNVFYACVFLATHFVLEKAGKSKALRTIFCGASFLIFFTVLAHLAAKVVSVPESDQVNGAILTLFSISFRVTVASLTAFIFAQYVNIYVYEWLRVKTKGRFLWLRINGANIVGQLVDSLLFFSIAFFDLSGFTIIQTILAGWILKVVVVALGTPFLYWDKHLKKSHEE